MVNIDPDGMRRALVEAESALEESQKENTSLRYTLSRMSIAASDLDPAVDEALDELRRQIKRSGPAEMLATMVDEIVHKLSDQTVDDVTNEQQGLLRRLVDEFRKLEVLNTKDAHKISLLLDKNTKLSYVTSRFFEILTNAMQTRLSRAANPSSPDSQLQAPDEPSTEPQDAVAQPTASLPLTSTLDSDPSMSQPRVAQHEAAIESSGDGETTVSSQSTLSTGLNRLQVPAQNRHRPPNFNEALKTLIAVVDVPEMSLTKQETIFKMLEQPIAYEDIEQVIEAISAFIVQIHQLEKDKFNQFIDGLNQRFVDVEYFLKYSVDRNHDRHDQTQNLSKQVNYRLDRIQDQYRLINDPMALIAILDEGFTAIRLNIENYQQLEQQKNEMLAEEIQTLQQQLKHTEQQALDLQSSLLLVSEQAQKDSLTGLLNRDAYESQLDNRLNRVRLLETSLVMAVADIDHFKSINDTYGHLAGDTVLKQVATIIRDQVKHEDFVARYGGEEFVLVLTDVDCSTAEAILNRIRDFISAQSFTLKRQQVNITVSFGYTKMCATDTKETAFSRADEALYQAKSHGRNRVVGL